MKIEKLIPRMIFDSRGYPTVEVDCVVEGGITGRASVPSGASTGAHEALELRDGGVLFDGKGVEKALENIRTHIAPHVSGASFSSQRELDTALISLDGTKNKSNLGANAMLAVSLAYAQAIAKAKQVPLYKHLREEFVWSKEMSIPVPLINVINGGKHALLSTDIQEWMIVPRKSSSLHEALEKSARVFYMLRETMKERGVVGVGDEGGFPLTHAQSNKEALEILEGVIQKAGYKVGEDFSFALDVASSEFYKDGKYVLERDNLSLSQEEMITYLENLKKEHAIVSIEDGLSEESWEEWKELTNRLGGSVQLVGDDLFVTNVEYVQKGGDMGVANAVLIKVNQIGTLSETVDAIELSHKLGKRAIVSHRSGETEDVCIAHLAVASGCGQIKTGSLSRTERLAKYNELLRIEEEGISYKGDIF